MDTYTADLRRVELRVAAAMSAIHATSDCPVMCSPFTFDHPPQHVQHFAPYANTSVAGLNGCYDDWSQFAADNRRSLIAAYRRTLAILRPRSIARALVVTDRTVTKLQSGYG